MNHNLVIKENDIKSNIFNQSKFVMSSYNYGRNVFSTPINKGSIHNNNNTLQVNKTTSRSTEGVQVNLLHKLQEIPMNSSSNVRCSSWKFIES